MTGSWEEYKRTNLYDKLGKVMDNLSEEEMRKIIKEKIDEDN